MSVDILKPINNIKTSINENDQVLWKSQAASKCYNQATANLKEKFQNINKEIVRIEDEVRELEPQIQISGSCYEVQVESLRLNQESLVNERLYKKLVSEDIKIHQKDISNTIDEYSQHLQKCKERLEVTNPTYKSLQTKRMELKKCKVNSLDLTKKISNIKKVNQQKIEIKRKLFNGDIIIFAQSWLKYKRYIEITALRSKEKQIEREYMKKLLEITDELKQKQKQGCYRKEIPFSIPQIEFSKNKLPIATKQWTENAKRQINNSFSDIKKMLEKKDCSLDTTNANKQNPSIKRNLQKNESSPSSSKIRILENKSLNRSLEKPSFARSKEERSKIIADKLQKVVENFNISRQNSKRRINRPAIKPIPNRTDSFNTKLSQKIIPSQEGDSVKMDVDQNVQYNGSGATQGLLNLSIDNQDNPDLLLIVSQESNKSSSDATKNNYKGTLNTPVNSQREMTAKINASKFFLNPPNSAPKTPENRFPPSVLATTSTSQAMGNINLVDNNGTSAKNIYQSSGTNQKPKNSFFGERSQFFLPSGFGDAFSKNVVKGGTMTHEQVNSEFKKPEDTLLERRQVLARDTAQPSLNITHSESTMVENGKENGRSMQNTQLNFNRIGNEYNKKLDRNMNNQGKGQIENMPISSGSLMNMGGNPQHNFGTNSQFSQILNDSCNESNKNLGQNMNNQGKENTETIPVVSGSLMNMGGNPSYNFGNNTQFSQILNDSYDYDGGYTSPPFEPNYMGLPAEETNIPIFGNQSDFQTQSFSFGQSMNPFSFK